MSGQGGRGLWNNFSPPIEKLARVTISSLTAKANHFQLYSYLPEVRSLDTDTLLVTHGQYAARSSGSALVDLDVLTLHQTPCQALTKWVVASYKAWFKGELRYLTAACRLRMSDGWTGHVREIERGVPPERKKERKKQRECREANKKCGSIDLASDSYHPYTHHAQFSLTPAQQAC